VALSDRPNAEFFESINRDILSSLRKIGNCGVGNSAADTRLSKLLVIGFSEWTPVEMFGHNLCSPSDQNGRVFSVYHTPVAIHGA